MTKNLVSTIIPVYNRSNLLQEAVNSVLAQTYRPIEIIIVDDGSTDDTPQIADKLVQQNPDEIKVLHITNRGPGLAREAGDAIAEGEFVQYLDSDNILLTNKFSLQVATLRKYPNCGIAYGKTRFYKINEKPINKAWKRTGEKINTMFPSFLVSRWWGTSTPLYRMELIRKAGYWLNIINDENWEYDCRIAAMNVKLCFVDEFISDEKVIGKGFHLSDDGSSCPKKLASRAIGQMEILKHAQTANISRNTPEMQHFSRALFLLARQCGAAGLVKESQKLFECAKQSATPKRAKSKDFYLYSLLANIIGWKILGKVSCWNIWKMNL